MQINSFPFFGDSLNNSLSVQNSIGSPLSLRMFYESNRPSHFRSYALSQGLSQICIHILTKNGERMVSSRRFLSIIAYLIPIRILLPNDQNNKYYNRNNRTNNAGNKACFCLLLPLLFFLLYSIGNSLLSFRFIPGFQSEDLFPALLVQCI